MRVIDDFLRGLAVFVLALWGSLGVMLSARLLHPGFPTGMIPFFLFLWMLPGILLLVTDWMREWPLGLLDAKLDLEDLKTALVRAEALRLGGTVGSWWFFVLAWLSLVVAASDIPLYGYAAWQSFRGRQVSSGWTGLEIGVAVLLLVGWLGYFGWVRFWRRNTPFWSMQAKRKDTWAAHSFPSPEFLLRNGEESTAFLSRFVAACPLPNLEYSGYLSRVWKLAPTIILTVFHLCVRNLGIDKGIISFLDLSCAVLLAFLVASIGRWLLVETWQWRFAAETDYCVYRPMLRLVQLARKLRG
ncbi:hypothetical protein JKG47_01785 [Acidithiobacillus sp. MC6.1]|nr:hypothetical protein [Acidithiobacillus sp. MC6.1]